MIEDVGELQRAAERIAERGVFLGSPPEAFSSVGPKVLDLLVRRGLHSDAMVADAGCGALRVGWWLVHYLEPNRYCGVEPRVEAVEAGVSELLGDEVAAEKRPRFDHNDRFDLSVFGERFDVVLCWAVWTHASKRQVEMLLDSFIASRAAGGQLVANYFPTRRDEEDYAEDRWVGQSHLSDRPGRVKHSTRWLDRVAGRRGLKIVEHRRWDNRGKRMVVMR